MQHRGRVAPRSDDAAPICAVGLWTTVRARRGSRGKCLARPGGACARVLCWDLARSRLLRSGVLVGRHARTAVCVWSRALFTCVARSSHPPDKPLKPPPQLRPAARKNSTASGGRAACCSCAADYHCCCRLATPLISLADDRTFQVVLLVRRWLIGPCEAVAAGQPCPAPVASLHAGGNHTARNLTPAPQPAAPQPVHEHHKIREIPPAAHPLGALTLPYLGAIPRRLLATGVAQSRPGPANGTAASNRFVHLVIWLE